MVDVASPEIGFVGVLGAVLLLIAWIPQTMRTIRTRRTGMEPKFLLIYLIGSFLLTVYAYFLGDIIFLVLNAAATIMDAINIYYYWHFERNTKYKNKNRTRQRRK